MSKINFGIYTLVTIDLLFFKSFTLCVRHRLKKSQAVIPRKINTGKYCLTTTRVVRLKNNTSRLKNNTNKI